MSKNPNQNHEIKYSTVEEEEKRIKRLKLINASKDLFAGSVSGMVSCLVGHPFDTIKVMLQDGASSGHLPKFKNGYHALKYLVQNEGIRGVYRGLSVPFVTGSCFNSIMFMTYHATRDHLRSDDDSWLLSQWKIALAGGIAGGMMSVFITPRDLIKSKLQIQCKPIHTEKYCPGQQYKGPIDVVRQVVKHNGYSGLFKGLRATFFRDFLGDMVYFSVYENMKKYLIYMTSVDKSSPNYASPPSWVAIVSGGASGCSFWASIYPLDVIKTRLQTQSEMNKNPKYTGIIQAAKLIYREEGFKTFYRGFSATIIRSFPTSACNFLVYETIKKFLNSKLTSHPTTAPGLEAL